MSILICHCRRAAIFGALALSGLLLMAQTQVELSAGNSKDFSSRLEEWQKARNSRPVNWDDCERIGRALQRDFPAQENSHQAMMSLANHYQRDEPERAKQLARQVVDGAAPENYKTWFRGLLHRLDSVGKPVAIRFTALDRREVDLARLKGKVVLIDFWAVWCAPCVVEMPGIKAAYDKFHAQGLEVIGINCDQDQTQLERFLKRAQLPWPEYFDGRLQADNRFTQAFGIASIPHMMLVDRSGCVRFDNVRLADLEERIKVLLAEKL